jgi:hypothetical protein
MSGNKLELALLMDEIRKKTVDIVEEKIKVFGSAGKAW